MEQKIGRLDLKKSCDAETGFQEQEEASGIGGGVERVKEEVQAENLCLRLSPFATFNDDLYSISLTEFHTLYSKPMCNGLVLVLETIILPIIKAETADGSSTN
jgi:hypothetical protein